MKDIEQLVSVEKPAIAPPIFPGDADHKSPEFLWQQLLEANRRFAFGESKPLCLVDERHITIGSQRPRIAILGCADSRVPPEHILNCGIGDLYVVRAAGNVADPVGIGSLEFAVEHLGCELLVVLGHECCGTVGATFSIHRAPTVYMNAILKQIRPAVQRAIALAPHATEAEKMSNAIEENVREVASRLLSSSSVLRRASDENEILVVPAVYDLATGLVRRLHAE